MCACCSIYDTKKKLQCCLLAKCGFIALGENIFHFISNTAYERERDLYCIHDAACACCQQSVKVMITLPHILFFIYEWIWRWCNQSYFVVVICVEMINLAYGMRHLCMCTWWCCIGLWLSNKASELFVFIFYWVFNFKFFSECNDCEYQFIDI